MNVASMSVHIGLGEEELITIFIGRLSPMARLMLAQDTSVCEGLPTVAAYRRVVRHV